MQGDNMPQDKIKTAIQEAEKKLEQERGERIKHEVYAFLKQELEDIDQIDSQIKKLHESKRIHEENIKNVKAGNIEAIEKRREAVNGTWQPFTYTFTYSNPVQFYNTVIAGYTVTVPSGKTIIF